MYGIYHIIGSHHYSGICFHLNSKWLEVKFVERSFVDNTIIGSSIIFLFITNKIYLKRVNISKADYIQLERDYLRFGVTITFLVCTPSIQLVARVPLKKGSEEKAEARRVKVSLVLYHSENKTYLQNKIRILYLREAI